MMNLRIYMCSLLTCASLSSAQIAAPPTIKLDVDLSNAPRKIIHATETMPVGPGPLTLVYPKWIPGEHGPTGPIDDLAGVTMAAQGTQGASCVSGGDGRLKWERDPVDMYAFRVTVPEGCATLTIQMDFLATAAPTGFSAGASTSENLALLSWNSVVLYPAGANAADVTVSPSISMASSWQYATALAPTTAKADELCRGSSQCRAIRFNTVSLERLIDSPVLAGKYFKEIELAPDVSPRHYLDLAADGPEDLNLSAEHIAAFSRLVREAEALYRSHHYSRYHFLVTLSDSVAHFGLEHHESSDDRVAARTFIDDDQFLIAGDLLPHEFTHSWNGKYRRPAGLATSNYQKPMTGELLWVYEGLTQYVGDVLATRSGIWTPAQFRGMLAERAAKLDNRPGRTWRDLQDTATSAQVLYDAGGGWDNWRRGTDFYSEGELIWLDVDSTVRKMTSGKKSLNDFLALFEGLGGNTPPKVVPYTFDDIVSGLNATVPNNWADFLRQRLDTNRAVAPLGGIENAGWKLTYEPRPNPWSDKENTVNSSVDFWFTLGLSVNTSGTLSDVLRDGPADKVGLGPGMRLVAVNGRAFTPALLQAAVNDAEGTTGPAVELIVENTGFYRVLNLAYHNGERYPTLERLANVPDTLDEITQPMVKSSR